MRRSVLVLVVLTVLAGAAGAVATPGVAASAPAACTVTWVGGASGSWESAAGWSPARVPARTDTVCFAAGTSPVVTVHRSTPVAGLTTGTATVAVGRSATLTVTRDLTVAGGTLAGPGGVVLGAAGGTSTSGRFTGTSRLAGGVRLTTASAGVVVTVGGTVLFSGGSVVSAYVALDDGAALRDADGLLTNALVGGTLDTEGPADVTVRMSQTALQLHGGPARLPRWSDVGVDGRLDYRQQTDVSFSGPATIPFPITDTGLAAVSLYRGAAPVAISTGRPAFECLERIGGLFTLFGGLTDLSPLTVAGTLVVVQAGSLTVPAFDVNGSGIAGVDGDLHTGTVTVSSPDATFGLGGTLDGSLEADVAQVLVAPIGRTATVSGAWTVVGDAQTSFRLLDVPSGRPVLSVGGLARIGGTLTLDPPDTAPAAGTRITLLTAAGGVAGRFASVSVPPAYRISYTATSVVATYLGTP